MVPGGFGSGFSKVIAEKIHSLSFEEVAKDIQGGKIMMLQGETQEKNIPELVADFMQKCADPVAGVEKAEQVSKALLENPKNKSIMIRMDAGAAVPDPATWLGCTSNDLHKDEGAAPWITCIKVIGSR